MKTIVRLALVSILFLFLQLNARSQDLTQVDKVHCTVLNDTSNVRLVMVTLHPGEKLESHTHPTWMAYFITGGKLGHTENGKTSVYEFKPGMHLMGGPTTAHSDQNVGDADMQFLLVEIKK